MANRQLLVASFCFMALHASAQVQTLGDLSFAPPPAWRYQGRPDGSLATLVFQDQKQYCRITVLRSVSAGRVTQEGFTSLWEWLVGRQASSWDNIEEHKSTIGYSGWIARNGLEEGNGAGTLRLYGLQAGEKFIVIIVDASANNMILNRYDDLAVFLDGVRVSPERARAPKYQVDIADIAGEWHYGADSTINYISATGVIYGSTVAHGSTYVIQPDGTFTSSFAGFNDDYIVRQKGAGWVKIDGNLITFNDTVNRTDSKYRLIHMQQARDGGRIMLLLPTQYEPSSDNLSNAEAWIRKAEVGQ